MSADIGASVRARLAHTNEVTTYIGSRIYADVLEQGSDSQVLPAVVVYVGGTNTEEDLNSSNRFQASSVNVWSFAADRTTANAIARAVRDYALAADLRGEVEGMNYLEVTLSNGPIEAVDVPRDGSDRWRRVTQQTFTIWATPL